MRKIGDQIVLIPVFDGVASVERVFYLSGVADRIWALTSEPANIVALISKICEEYEIEHSQATNDVEEFIEEMLSLGLLERIES